MGALLRSEMPNPPLRMVMVLCRVIPRRYLRQPAFCLPGRQTRSGKMQPLLSPITIKLASLRAAIFCIKSWMPRISFCSTSFRRVGISAISSACILRVRSFPDKAACRHRHNNIRPVMRTALRKGDQRNKQLDLKRYFHNYHARYQQVG